MLQQTISKTVSYKINWSCCHHSALWCRAFLAVCRLHYLLYLCSNWVLLWLPLKCFNKGHTVIRGGCHVLFVSPIDYHATDITGYHRLAYCCTWDIHLWVLNPYEICTFSDLSPYRPMFIKHLEVTVSLVESGFHEHFSWIIYSSCKRTTKTVYRMGNNVMYGFLYFAPNPEILQWMANLLCIKWQLQKTWMFVVTAVKIFYLAPFNVEPQKFLDALYRTSVTCPFNLYQSNGFPLPC